jgi:putative aminopeptidase FrvX
MDNSASIVVLLNLMKTQLVKMREKKVAVLFATLEEEGLLVAEAFMNMSNFNITNLLRWNRRGRIGAMNIRN